MFARLFISLLTLVVLGGCNAGPAAPTQSYFRTGLHTFEAVHSAPAATGAGVMRYAGTFTIQAVTAERLTGTYALETWYEPDEGNPAGRISSTASFVGERVERDYVATFTIDGRVLELQLGTHPFDRVYECTGNWRPLDTTEGPIDPLPLSCEYWLGV